MSVCELVDDPTRPEFASTFGTLWVNPRTVPGSVVDWLATRARVPHATVEFLVTPWHWSDVGPKLQYCVRCLFLNSEDVSSPRWRRDWLNPEMARCVRHDGPLEQIRTSTVARCANLAEVLRVASRHESIRDRRRLHAAR